MARKRSRETFVCPHCGADVPVGAISCRECGSDDESGWSDDGGDWNADIPTGYGGDDHDHDAFLDREFPGHASPGQKARRWAWRLLVILVLMAVIRSFVLS